MDGKSGLNRKKLYIAIPASVVSDTPHLREKTSKIGSIGRTAAIFRVDEIIVYPDIPEVSQSVEVDLIATLLSYMETPQYLRKRLFTIKPELQYAGILPPLRTPHHPLNRKMQNLKIGEYREGVTLSKAGEGTLVDIGVEKPALLRNERLRFGERATVKIVNIDKEVEVEPADRRQIPVYWGYRVIVENQPLGKVLKNRNFDLIIGTSRYGVPFTDVAAELSHKWKKAETIAVVFGAPSQGLNEIIKREKMALDDVMDFVVNTIPAQGTETVRTEEALVVSMAILNVNFGV
jgi:hypothetical protein